MSIATRAIAFRLPHARFVRWADGLAIAAAASLPWSTSATGILVAFWLITMLPTIDIAGLRRIITMPAGGLPVLLVALGVVGILWSEASWQAAFGGLPPFLKLLVIPLLFFHFQRSERGEAVLLAFLIACALLLFVSLIMAVWERPLGFAGKGYGIPVKDRIIQSGEFVMAAFAALYMAVDAFRRNQRGASAGLFVLAAAFLFNVLYVTTSRTALVLIPPLLLLLAARLFGWRAALIAGLAGVVLAAAVWFSSRNVRERVMNVFSEVQAYQEKRAETSSGFRLDFWRKSVGFIADAPIIGHGTGSIRHMFAQTVTGETGQWAVPTGNPHNQTLAVGVQLGFVGIAVLFALWGAHFVLFVTPGLIGWIGLMVVSQNIISSLFNSHLFDFTAGWTYVLGVGVAGGIVLRGRSGATAQRPL